MSTQSQAKDAPVVVETPEPSWYDGLVENLDAGWSTAVNMAEQAYEYLPSVDVTITKGDSWTKK